MKTTLPISRPSLRWLTTGLVAGLLAASMVGPAAVTAQDQSADDTLRTISVSGTGIVKAEPDVADINLGVTMQGQEAAEAAAKAAEAMDSMISALLELGIDEKDIQTTSLNLSPRYDWNKDPAPIVAWEASNMVSVTVRDIESVGDVVDTATGAGATNVSGISFRIEDASEYQAAARTAAVEDARDKADQLAAAAGVTITGVVSISESGSSTPEPIYYARSEMAMADMGASTPVMAGEVDTVVYVSIQYEIDG